MIRKRAKTGDSADIEGCKGPSQEYTGRERGREGEGEGALDARVCENEIHAQWKEEGGVRERG